MRKKRSAKTTIGYIVVFILALALSIVGVQVFPIPGDYKMMTFFLSIPAISFLGVFILSKTGKRRK